jgi:beta-N-acetylhexosaminidase
LSLTTVASVAGAALAATTASPAAAAAAAATPATEASVLARMSTAQRVGQLFMVGTPGTGASASTLSAIRKYHVGNVMLTGRSYIGTSATKRVSDGLQTQVSASSTASVPLFVATDQEGGQVQVLHGPGFSTMPSALTQGAWSPTTLRANAKKWGAQLRSAGVNVNLGPVVDTVPSPSAAKSNPPIGAYNRQFGYTPATVASHGTAFAQGLADAGVAASVKHFPGLGRVSANTDTSTGVTDRSTVRHDPYLTPFASAVKSGAPFVMMSTAYYSRIDAAHPAAFSPTVIKTLLRGDLKFRGVVISDDLGNARQVAKWSPGARAVSFIGAGGDMVLTVNPSLLPQMYNAVLAKANSSATFRAQVDASALRVLTAKANTGVGLVRATPKPTPAPAKVSYARYYGTTLRQGSTGGVVAVLQRALGGLVADGDFGPATKARVQALETASGLPVDGVADRALWQVLSRDYSAYYAVTLRQGSTGASVKVLQGALGGLAVDGNFGPGTRAKVVAFQKAHHLTADGVVNKPEWAAF